MSDARQDPLVPYLEKLFPQTSKLVPIIFILEENGFDVVNLVSRFAFARPDAPVVHILLRHEPHVRLPLGMADRIDTRARRLPAFSVMNGIFSKKCSSGRGCFVDFDFDDAAGRRT